MLQFQKSILKKIKKTIERKLLDSGITDYVEGREKHIYSIYRKMKESHRHFDEITDVSAFKIIVDNVDNCYRG